MSEATSSVRDNILRSHGGIFLFVCFFYYSKKISFETIISAEAITFAVYSSGNKHALRKTAYVQKRTCVAGTLTYYIEAYIHPNLFTQVRDQFDAFFNPKDASKKHA